MGKRKGDREVTYLRSASSLQTLFVKWAEETQKDIVVEDYVHADQELKEDTVSSSPQPEAVSHHSCSCRGDNLFMMRKEEEVYSDLQTDRRRA